MIGIEVSQWKSSMCTCSATMDSGGNIDFSSCDDEHLPWCQMIGRENLTSKLKDLEKMVRRGVPNSFLHIIERFGKSESTFHKPQLVKYDSAGPSPELALFLMESIGCSISACTNPEKLATLLSGKAIQGLSEKMWIEDWWGEFQDPLAHRLFLPEEFVASGALDIKAAEAMFRPLNAELLWLSGRDDD